MSHNQIIYLANANNLMARILTILFLIFSLSTFELFACHLSVAASTAPPLVIKTGEEKWSGITFQYLESLLSEAHCTYDIVEVPFARGLKMLESGQIDLALEITRTKEREKHFYFVGPYRKEEIRLVTRSNLSINSWEELATTRARLIKNRGSFYGTKLNEVFELNKFLKSSQIDMIDFDTSFNLIIKNRADGVFIEQSQWFEISKKFAREKLILQPLVIFKSPVYFALSKNSTNENLVKKLDSALTKLH